MKKHYSVLLLLSVLFFILVQGSSKKCGISSIQIQQSAVGTSADKLDTVFQVEVKNLCRCAVRSVFLNSNGFASSITVDPKVFRLEGNYFILNDGRSIASQSSVTFLYAWDHYFKMTPASFQATC